MFRLQSIFAELNSNQWSTYATNIESKILDVALVNMKNDPVFIHLLCSDYFVIVTDIVDIATRNTAVFIFIVAVFKKILI